MKVAIITCSPNPEYIRAQVLRDVLGKKKSIDLTIVKNKHRNFLRYGEVWIKILITRLRVHPDVYILTFRGYETLPILLLLSWHKPVIFDEMVNLVEWSVYEHHIVKPKSISAHAIDIFYRLQLKMCRFILADTEAHADYSSRLSRIDREKYRVVPLSVNESIFKPTTQPSGDTFRVFYYGQRTSPLQGLDHILEAAEVISKKSEIEFYIVGGDKKTEERIATSIENGAHIVHEKKLPIEELAAEMSKASVSLGGPFGDTLQARKVITNKTYQSLALGLPTIIGENEETDKFSNRTNCLLVPLGDSMAIRDAILWGFNNRDELKRIGKNGRSLYERIFSNDSVSEQITSLIRDLA